MRKVFFSFGLMVSLNFANAQCWKAITTSPNAYHNVAIADNGSLWAWGYNGLGQIGTGNTTGQNSQIQIGSDTNWQSVACGEAHTIGIKTDGSLWAWGWNNYGQLGIGSVAIVQSSPIQVGSATNWQSVACGQLHTIAIKTDGSLWAWGRNQYGQIGNGNIPDQNSPIKVGNANNWKSVVAGAYHTIAIKTDGSLWAWGFNADGELGIGNNIDQSTPMQIGSFTNWKSVVGGAYHTMGIKTDGSLWAWGFNFYGQLGIGNTTNQSSPIQIGSATNWELVAGGDNHTMGIKADNSLWAWGNNDYLQLGIGNNISQSSPIKIGSANNWKLVASGKTHTTALKTNGSLWTFGDNSFGQLGTNNNSSHSNPIGIICPSILPLNLLSFTAQLQQNKVALNWHTTNEINVSHINIQRSNNGKDFTTIGKVNATGVGAYSFLDMLSSLLPSPLGEGLGVRLNYRLEIVDKDGSKTYSEIKKLEVKSQNQKVNIYPNPSKDFVTIECAGAKELLITDYLGKTIKQFNNPTQPQTINTKQLNKGIFIVKATMNNGEIKTEKLVVE